MRDIAIVGMGCRFPGASDLDGYWRLLESGVRQFRSVPPGRWDHSRYFDPTDHRASGKAYTDQVAYLEEVDRFDAVHYRMAPRRVRWMDPQHRLLLDVSREAIQDAGWERRPYDKTNTGVYFALSVSDFVQLSPGVNGMADAYALPGSLLNMAAATVSQYYDLGGPSFTLDSACSSGLTALAEAVTALRAGICTEALVGAAFLNLVPLSLIGFSRVGALSAAGVCRPFDRRADGFVLGEGVGAVLLRPLDDAVAAGDRVYAVIRGIGCSNDGTAEGPMTPREDGQVRAMARAYQESGVSARTVGLIEAHGTATLVGDRVEMSSLTRIREDAAQDGDQDVPAERCYLSSVKSLIGHSTTASGMASLIKSALALHHREIPPQPATEIEESLGLDRAGLRLPDTLTPWETDGATPRRAAINSFGFGGTNVHVVLEEAPTAAAARTTIRVEPRGVTSDGEHPAEVPELFQFSAGSLELLQAHLERVLRLSIEDPSMSPAALAATLAGRSLLRARVAIVAASRAELHDRMRQAINALAEGRTGILGDGMYATGKAVRQADRRVALVYPGQGSQRPGMLHDLYERYPAFRDAADHLDELVETTAGFSPLRAVYGDGAFSPDGEKRLTGTDVCQPTLGVLEVAATRLAESCGLTPHVTLGHSVGEFPAAATAGIISPADTVRMMAERGAAMRDAEGKRPGGMMAVQVADGDIESLTAGIAKLWPACYNHPRQTVLAGTPAALRELAKRCAAQDIRTQSLAVSNAFHTPLLDGVRDRIAATVEPPTLEPPTHTFVSCVAGEVCDSPDAMRELWKRHASTPVRFAQSVVAAYETGARVFVQVVGGASLLSTIRHNLSDREGCQYVALSDDAPDDGRAFLNGLAHLTTLGIDIDATAVTDHRQALLGLPVSPLLNRSYPTPSWTDDETPHAPRLDGESGATKPGLPDAVPSAPSEELPMNNLTTILHEQIAQQSQLFRDQLALLRDAAPAGAREAVPAAPSPAVPAVAAVAAVAPQSAPAPTPAPESAPGGQYAEVKDTVYRQVARISAFPVDQFTGYELLVQELGFDSLMITELITALRRTWPQLVGVASGLPKRPTITEMVAAIASSLGIPAEPAARAEIPAPAPAPALAADGTAPETAIQPENGLAGLVEVATHDAGIAELGRNPYFLTHESNSRDTTRIAGRELLSFSSYNYLGLSGHPYINDSVYDAIRQYGTSVSASRFLSGDRPLHHELESELSTLLGTDDAIVMVSGHATNVSVIGHLLGRDDLVVHDELAHDSILQGCTLSGATRRPFAHNDPAALDAILTRHREHHRRCLVVIEGVYSMDGDIADLPAIVDVKQRHGALLMVDEAHSIGVAGPHGGGIGDHFDIDRSLVEMWSGTLSKSLASCGGYVAGNRTLVDYLKYNVPGFVYSVGITPGNTAAALAAIQVMRKEPERLSRLAANSEMFLRLATQAGVNTGTSKNSPVIPCIVGDSERCLALSHRLFDRGISVNPIIYPGVPEELARLRFFVTSEHTPEQIERTVAVLAEELAGLGVPKTMRSMATA